TPPPSRSSSTRPASRSTGPSSSGRWQKQRGPRGLLAAWLGHGVNEPPAPAPKGALAPPKCFPRLKKTAVGTDGKGGSAGARAGGVRAAHPRRRGLGDDAVPERVDARGRRA